jgi:uncharacterized protein YcfL
MRKRLLILLIIVLLTGCLPEQPSINETKTIESVMAEVKTKMAIQETIKQTLVTQINLTEMAKATTTPVPSIIPTVPPPQPEFSNVNYFRDKNNNLIFLGMLNNSSDKIISEIIIEVQLLDTNGNLVGMSQGNISTPRDIKPQQKAPFFVTFRQNDTSWDKYIISISKNENSGSSNINCIEPEITNLYYNYDNTHEAGEAKSVIRNNTDKILNVVWQTYVLYDDQNRVVGVSTTTFTGILVPGQETNAGAPFGSRIQPNAIVKNVEAFLCGELR